MRKILFLFGLFISLVTIQAQTWGQLGTDIDGEAANDFSGFSVSLSSDGSIVAIGAKNNDGNGPNSGHVRIYKYNAGTWTQIGADIDGEAANNYSGTVSLSSDGSIVAIGAYRNSGTEAYVGNVRVFQNVSGTWTQIGADIYGEASYDFSGSSISLNSNGSIVAIGAFSNSGNGSYSGHVRVYKNIAGTWTQIGSDIDGEAADDNSGSVSLSSDGLTLAIGAWRNDGNGIDSGHVRIYHYVSGAWTQIGADIDGENAGDRSGLSVSLSSDGSIVAIGAHVNGDNGSYSGHVRVFKNIAGLWTQVGEDIDGEAAEDWSGKSVSLSSDGSIVAIGSPYNDGTGTDAGQVRVYQNISDTWTLIGEDIDGEATDDNFGSSVSLSSDGLTVAIGAIYNDDNGNNSGSVRVFRTGTAGISEIEKIGVLIFPNPSTGVFTIKNAKDCRITITDIMGKQLVVKTQIKQNEAVDLSSFRRGIYFVKIETNRGLYTTKIVKE